MTSLPPFDDPSFDDAAVEALLAGAGDPADPLTGALQALRGEGGRAVPAPAPGLAELLGKMSPPDELSRRRRAARIAIGVVVAGSATLGLSGVAAAHDALPDPAQGVVTDIVNELTPFHIGRDLPLSRPPVTPAAPTDTPVPTAGRSPSPTVEDRPSAHPTGASDPGRSDDRSGGRRGTGSGDGGSGDRGSTDGGSGSGDGGTGGGAGSGSGGGGSDDSGGSGPTGGSDGSGSTGGSDGGSGGSDSGGSTSGSGGSDGGSGGTDSGGSDSGSGH